MRGKKKKNKADDLKTEAEDEGELAIKSTQKINFDEDKGCLCAPRALRLITIGFFVLFRKCLVLFSASTESLPFSWFLNRGNVFAY